ncbi:hypothetical protein CRG98_023500 [Punica granatum]|uniref:F-box domain-containing protein n=1 Tax=Punica granatum TaxID=22663 RepID=A0A2I0JJL0_PUNGR|nr:hypothetical protein CRG98_023500 [Punica granatum]
MEKAVDRISDLPTHLMDQILVRLPIKEAVRTSILSTKWRYKWASIPELVFHNDLECHPIDGRRLVDIVDHVLRSHVGPTVKFEACHEDVYDSRTINRWILRLSRMHIGEFVFYNIHWKGHRLSTRLFALRDLVHLQLSWCIIKLPVRFTGLRKLDSLELTSVSLTQDDIELLISSSPRLTKLRLHHLIDDVECLNISAPNLKVIDIWSSYQDINFQTPNCLFSVAVGLYRDSRHFKPRLNVSSRSLQGFLLDLPLTQTLKFKNCALKCFSEGHIPEKLPQPCTQLKYLSFAIDFGSPKEILTAFCLLRSCPNLEEVEFKEEYGSRKPFEQVKFLPFSNTGGLEAEIGLMKFLLVNSPGLKRIKVQVSYYERVREVYLEKLVELPRASPQVRIIYEHDSLKFDQEFDDEILPEVA